MRLFVAVDVPDPLKAAIEDDVVGALRDRLEGARWTRPEGRHLTLKFLGNVDDARVREISDTVRTASEAHVSFDAAFSEIGGFPDLRRPRVLWIGLGEGAGEMARLAGDLEAGFARLGFEREDRPFRGHLTLARFPRPRIVDVPEISAPSARFEVTDVILFQSQLHPKGARYTALERFPLRPAE